MREQGAILLVSCYELGHQPLSLASPLAVLREAGFDIDIAAHVRRGGAVLGLCGGYQMLGTRIADPDGVEGPAGSVPGLGLPGPATHTCCRTSSRSEWLSWT